MPVRVRLNVAAVRAALVDQLARSPQLRQLASVAGAVVPGLGDLVDGLEGQLQAVVDELAQEAQDAVLEELRRAAADVASAARKAVAVPKKRKAKRVRVAPDKSASSPATPRRLEQWSGEIRVRPEPAKR